VEKPLLEGGDEGNDQGREVNLSWGYGSVGEDRDG